MTARLRLPLPTEAELDVLNVLWARGPATVREVHETLSATKDVGYTTVLKQMQVMLDKGLVERSERFRSHVYTARLLQQETRQQLAGNLLERAFAGSARDLVLGALGAKKVSAKELLEIRQILNQYEADNRLQSKKEDR